MSNTQIKSECIDFNKEGHSQNVIKIRLYKKPYRSDLVCEFFNLGIEWREWYLKRSLACRRRLSKTSRLWWAVFFHPEMGKQIIKSGKESFGWGRWRRSLSHRLAGPTVVRLHHLHLGPQVHPARAGRERGGAGRPWLCSGSKAQATMAESVISTSE